LRIIHKCCLAAAVPGSIVIHAAYVSCVTLNDFPS
jgi:hypothetical protein